MIFLFVLFYDISSFILFLFLLWFVLALVVVIFKLPLLTRSFVAARGVRLGCSLRLPFFFVLFSGLFLFYFCLFSRESEIKTHIQRARVAHND